MAAHDYNRFADLEPHVYPTYGGIARGVAPFLNATSDIERCTAQCPSDCFARCTGKLGHSGEHQCPNDHTFAYVGDR